MGKPDAPKPPSAADLQPILDQQARLNRTNQQNPYGSQTWNEGPNGQWTNTTQFSDPAQALFERQMHMAAAQPMQIQQQTNPLVAALSQGLQGQMGETSPHMQQAMSSAQKPSQATKPAQPGLPDINMGELLAGDGDDNQDGPGTSRPPIPGNPPGYPRDRYGDYPPGFMPRQGSGVGAATGGAAHAFSGRPMGGLPMNPMATPLPARIPGQRDTGRIA